MIKTLIINDEKVEISKIDLISVTNSNAKDEYALTLYRHNSNIPVIKFEKNKNLNQLYNGLDTYCQLLQENGLNNFTKVNHTIVNMENVAQLSTAQDDDGNYNAHIILKCGVEGSLFVSSNKEEVDEVVNNYKLDEEAYYSQFKDLELPKLSEIDFLQNDNNQSSTSNDNSYQN